MDCVCRPKARDESHPHTPVQALLLSDHGDAAGAYLGVRDEGARRHRDALRAASVHGQLQRPPTDRGPSSSTTRRSRRSVDGGRRCPSTTATRCSPGRRAAARNHVELRKILPKETCFEESPTTSSIICSHVNSYTRPVLGGAAPIDIASRIPPADLFDGLAIRKINPDEVVARPSLAAELGAQVDARTNRESGARDRTEYALHCAPWSM